MAPPDRRSLVVTLSDDLHERLRAAAGPRGMSEFVRDAVEVRLAWRAGLVAVEEPQPREEGEGVGAGVAADAVELPLPARSTEAVVDDEAVVVVAGGVPAVPVEEAAQESSHGSILEFGQCPGCGGLETGQVSARQWRCSGCDTMFTP